MLSFEEAEIIIAHDVDPKGQIVGLAKKNNKGPTGRHNYISEYGSEEAAQGHLVK